MKQLPKPITVLLLTLGFMLLSYVIFAVANRDSSSTGQDYLDQIQIQTGNPQPAGKNISQ